MSTTLVQERTQASRPTTPSRRPAEYKVVIYQEAALASLLLGSAKVNPLKFGEFLNLNARQGWRVVTMEKDMRRMFLFWKREAYLVIMEKSA